MKNSSWYLVEYGYEPGLRQGASIAKIIKILKQAKPLQFVILFDIYAHAYSLAKIKLWENYAIPAEIDELIEILPEVWEFEWGDFFLFEKFPANWRNKGDLKYPPLVKQCDT